MDHSLEELGAKDLVVDDGGKLRLQQNGALQRHLHGHRGCGSENSVHVKGAATGCRRDGSLGSGRVGLCGADCPGTGYSSERLMHLKMLHGSGTDALMSTQRYRQPH